jgi:SAM-dependent methyltransferase
MSGSAIDAEAFNAFEAAGWETKAAGYEDFFGGITSRVIEPLLDAAGVGDGTRLLDVATGPGYGASRAAERGADAVGIDIAEAMVTLAGRLHPGLEFRRADAEALPFDDASFDAVVGNFVMLHLGRPERAAAEFVRVVRAGGRVALTVWDLPEHARFLGVFLDAVAEAGATLPSDIPVGPPFFRFSDDSEFVRLLAGQGLDDVDVRPLSFVHPVASPDELWRGMLDATVRTSALILRQPEEAQGAIRSAFERLVDEYRVGDGLALPVSVKLASGRRPAAAG